jgi:hypothetical protein
MIFVAAGPDTVGLADRATLKTNPAFYGTNVFLGPEIAL